MDIVLFHSVYGLRPAEITAAGRWRAGGHRVVTPDLYQEEAAVKITEGFALAEIPATIRPGLPVQAHVAEPDEFFPLDRVAAWGRAARASGAELTLFRYPEAGHLFTDPELPDHDETAADLLWQRSLLFLGGLA
jgi:dienelactone hydrolase